MCFLASAAFTHLLILIEHINHGTEISIGQAGIVDPDCSVWGHDNQGGYIWPHGNVVREVIDL
jgi:hypothetical protein